MNRYAKPGVALLLWWVFGCAGGLYSKFYVQAFEASHGYDPSTVFGEYTVGMIVFMAALLFVLPRIARSAKKEGANLLLPLIYLLEIGFAFKILETAATVVLSHFGLSLVVSPEVIRGVLTAAECIAVIALICFVFFAGKRKKIYLPGSGIWYCEEKKLQIVFDQSCAATIQDGTQPLECSWSIEENSNHLQVCNRDDSSNQYFLGEPLFTGVCVRGDDKSFSVKETDSNKIYTFSRIG